MSVADLMLLVEKGGLFAVLLLLMGTTFWLQQRQIADLKDRVEKLGEKFEEYKLRTAEQRITRDDLDRLEAAIEKGFREDRDVIKTLFERIEKHTSDKCGNTCLAAQARQGGCPT